MLRKILVANRGEIALRIVRACQELGVASVAVYSDADAHAPHVREADEAIRIGPPPSSESYLLGDVIIGAAKRVGADAIHPGYGFLAERDWFARAVRDAGLVWIGPPPAPSRSPTTFPWCPARPKRCGTPRRRPESPESSVIPSC